MLTINPRSVTLLGHALEGVASIATDRTAERLVVERGEGGPHATFVDAPQVRVRIVIRRTVESDELGLFRPGDEGSLRYRAGMHGSLAREVEASATVVVASVTHGAGSSARAIEQRIEVIAVSVDGAADPVSIQEVSA